MYQFINISLPAIVAITFLLSSNGVVAQNPVCYICGGDADATLNNPDVLIEGTISCDQIYQAGLQSLFTQEECAIILEEVGIQMMCGCSNLEAPVAAPVSVPAPVPVAEVPTPFPVVDVPVSTQTPFPTSPVVIPAPVDTGMGMMSMGAGGMGMGMSMGMESDVPMRPMKMGMDMESDIPKKSPMGGSGGNDDDEEEEQGDDDANDDGNMGMGMTKALRHLRRY